MMSPPHSSLQAIALDKTGVYQLKLDEAHHHLGLSIQLYSTPENTLDKVTALLEQVQQHTHRERDTHTLTHTHRERHTHTNTHTHRHAHTHTHTHTHAHTRHCPTHHTVMTPPL